MTTDEILALPILEASYLAFMSDENGEVQYNGRTLYTSESHMRLHIPVVPETLAVYVSETDPFWAVDEDGMTWQPVMTTEGLRRRPVGQALQAWMER